MFDIIIHLLMWFKDKEYEKCYRILGVLEKARLIYVEKNQKQWLPQGGCGQQLMEKEHEEINSCDRKVFYFDRVRVT